MHLLTEICTLSKLIRILVYLHTLEGIAVLSTQFIHCFVLAPVEKKHPGIMNDLGLNSREQSKREVVRLTQLLRSAQMTDKNRADIVSKIEIIEDSMRDFEPEIDEAAFAERQETLEQNAGLKEIFRSFWFCVSHMTNSENELEKAGYVQFHLRLSRALGATYDFSNEEAALHAAERDYSHDVEVYGGSITQAAFNDIIFQVVDMYTEYIDAMYYQSFSWAVLDAIANLEKSPPRLKPLAQVECIMKLENEAAMVTAYIDAKPEVAKLTIMNNWMERVPDVQKRMAARRGGNLIGDASIDTLHAVTRRLKKTAGESETDSDIDEVDEQSAGLAQENKNDYVVETKTKTKTKTKPDAGAIVAVKHDSAVAQVIDDDDPLDTMIKLRYERKSQETISHESYFRKKNAGEGKKAFFRAGGKACGVYVASNAIQAAFKETKDMREKSSFRRRSVLLHTTSLAHVKTYEKGNTRRTTPKEKKEGADGLTGVTPPQTSLNASLIDDSTPILGEGSVYISSKEMFVEDVVQPKKKITDPYDNDYEDVGDVDAEWAAFREHLQLVNEHDRAMQRIAAEEQARRDEEIRKQNEDALKFKEARERAEADELVAKLAAEAAVAAAAQAANDRLLATVSLDKQLLNTPHMNLQSSTLNAHFDSLPRAYVQGSSKDGDEAIDEASQFDITFNERYELDSFFAASAAASIASEMSADELVYEAANAASIAAKKVKEAAELAAKATSRVLKMQDAFEGYEDLQVLKALKREQEKQLLRQEMDSITGSSSKVSIKRLIELQKREMESKVKELADARILADKEQRKQDTLSSAIAAGEASIKSKESSPPPTSKRKKKKSSSRAASSLATRTSINDSSVVNTLTETRDNDSVGMLSQVTGTDFDIDGSSLADSEVEGAFDLTGLQTADNLGGQEMFGVSYAGSSIIDDYAGESYTPKQVDHEQQDSELLLIEKRKAALESKQFPFPHKSYYSIVKKTQVDMSEGQLGSWNHERAVKLNLLARAGNIVDEDYEKMQLSLIASSPEKSLEIKARPLPWFADEVKRTRGKTGRTNIEKQRALIQPGDLRFIKEVGSKNSIASPVSVKNPVVMPNPEESVVLEQNPPSELNELSQILSVNTIANSEELPPIEPNESEKVVAAVDAVCTPHTQVSTPQVADPYEIGILEKMRIKQNNAFIAQMVSGANMGRMKQKEPTLLVAGTVSAFKGFDAKPVIDAKAYGKLVDFPHNVEKQTSPIHPNRGFRISNKFVGKTVQVQSVSESTMTRSEFNYASPTKETISKNARDVRSPTADAALRIALGTDTTTSPARTPPVMKMTPKTAVQSEEKIQDTMTDALNTYDSPTATKEKPKTPMSATVKTPMSATVAVLEKSRIGVENPSLTLRSYQRYKSDYEGKQALVVCSEKTMSAVMPAIADPVGPASTLGADSIEEHPRFRYSGLPSPLLPAPTHYSSKATSLALLKKKFGVISEPEFVPDLNLNISSTTASMDPPFWLPKAVKCLNDPMHHDRSSHINGWDDLKTDLKSRNPNADAERANVLLTIKRQQAYLLRFNDYVTTTKARNSNVEFVNFVNKDIPVLTEGNKKALYNFYDKYELPLVQQRVTKLKVEKDIAERRKQAFHKRRDELEALEFA